MKPKISLIVFIFLICFAFISSKTFNVEIRESRTVYLSSSKYNYLPLSTTDTSEVDAALLSILDEELVIASVTDAYDEWHQKWFNFLIGKEEVSIVDVLRYVGLILLPILVILLIGYVLTVRRSIKRKTQQIENNHLTNEIILKAFKKDFSTAKGKYDYVLQELLSISSSTIGLVLKIDQYNNVDVKTCESKNTADELNPSEVLVMLQQSGILKEIFETTNPIVVNNYDAERPNQEIVICNQKVHRLMILSNTNNDSTKVVVLANNPDKYSKNIVNQSLILMTGLCNMIEKKEKSEEVVYISLHDSLTGLYNRRFFEDSMKRIDNPRNYPITIVFGDVNEFKKVNDTLGHHQGDELLKIIANILVEHSRANDIVARWGGDEFVIIMPNTSFENSKHLINRIQKDIVKIEHRYGQISIAIGQSTKSNIEEDLTLLFREAEEMMYKNKDAFMNNERK